MSNPEYQLFFDSEEWKKLQEICEKGYPKEVCGLLLGKPLDRSKENPKIMRVVPLINILSDSKSQQLSKMAQSQSIQLPPDRVNQGGKFEFLIDPKEHYQKLKEAYESGLDQIGLFHSHPDHPAIPSPIDASQPFLAGWSNIIVAVHQGRFKEARSWYRISERDPFQEEKIFVT